MSSWECASCGAVTDSTVADEGEPYHGADEDCRAVHPFALEEDYSMIGRIRAFLLGLREARGNVGMTYDDDPGSPRSIAYDRGRTLGRRLARLED